MFDSDTDQPAIPDARDRKDGTYLIFDMGGQTMGVDVRHVCEILGLPKVSRMPAAGGRITGVIDLRGRCVPLVDLGPDLALPKVEPDEEARVVVFESSEGEQIGAIAERVRDVVRIEAASVEAPSRIGNHAGAGRVIGMTRLDGRLVFLLDIATLLASHWQGGSDGRF